MISGAEYILRKLETIGVNHIFGIPGAHIDPLFTATTKTNIKTIINCHELSAGYMADGYSRCSGKLGVVLSIASPGSNNLITAVNTARIEQAPLLVISGDVPTNLSNVPGFQNGNSLGSNDDELFKIVTKYTKRVNNINELILFIEEAIRAAYTPPFGPAHLIIPYDVFNTMTPVLPKAEKYHELKYWKNKNSEEIISHIKSLLLSEKKVVFWIGTSLNKREQSKQIVELATKFNIPVATSYGGKGIIPENNKLALGNFGYAGSSLSKELLLSDQCDVIIGFDIEQNERNSLNWNPNLYKNKDIVLINFPGSFSNAKYGKSFENNPFYILKTLHDDLIHKTYDNGTRKRWFEKFKQKVNSSNVSFSAIGNETIEPGRIIEIVQKEVPKESILFVDSGNHRIFPGFHWKTQLPESFYSAEKTAPLGWAIAAGIGCKIYRKEPVIIFTGDGCMQMHGIELKTASKHSIPVLVIIANNSAFGNVHVRYSKISDDAADLASITEINWNLFSKSFGATVFDITSEKCLIEKVHDFLLDEKLTILNIKTPVNPYILDKSLTKSAFA